MPPICFNPPAPPPHFALSTSGTLHFRRIFSRRPPGIPPRPRFPSGSCCAFRPVSARFPPPNVVHSSPPGDRMSIFYRTNSLFPIQTGRNCVRTQRCGRPHFRFFGYICGMSVPGSRLRHREPGKARRTLFFSSDIFVIFVSNESPDDRTPACSRTCFRFSTNIVIFVSDESPSDRTPACNRTCFRFSTNIVIFVSDESPGDRMPGVAPAALFPSEGLVILYIGITRKNTEA